MNFEVNGLGHKMIMTAGYPEMAILIRELADELRLDITVVEGILDEAAQEVKRLVQTDTYEVVISRAGTAAKVREVIDLPIVYSDSEHLDLLQGFIEAKKLGDRICFITFPEEGFLFNFEEVTKILGFEVSFYPYQSDRQLIEQIKQAKEDGMDVIVGGGVRSANIASSYGMKSMYLPPNPRTIKRALVLADQVARDRVMIKEEAERLDAVINVSEEGIIFLNEEGIIESMNAAAEKIFNVSRTDYIGKSKEQISLVELKNILLKSSKHIEGGNFTLGTINVSYSPVIVGYTKIGTFVNCREVSKIQKLEQKIRRDLHLKGHTAKFTFDEIIHEDPIMEEVIDLAKEYAKTESTVLIIGESGTGKELFAQSIHNESSRNKGPFVAINCAALPENLLESELFGYTEGAFTGASKGGRQGVFELAHEGTIFLDEIGEIPTHIQTRLLRVLQEKEVMRLGGEGIIPIDIRVIAATNKNLWEMVDKGEFRLDLYFRLSILHLDVPALRKRELDIPLLVDRHFQKLNHSIRFSDLPVPIQYFFKNYSWPGNVRQLENVVERYILYSKNVKKEKFFVEDILKEMGEGQKLESQGDELIVRTGTLDEINKQVIMKMLEEHNDNKKVVAELLGISRTTLWKRISEI